MAVPPASAIRSCDSSSVSGGRGSLSLMISSTAAGSVTPRSLSASPRTYTRFSSAYTSLSTAVIVTSPLAAALAAMVRSRSGRSTSDAVAGATGSTLSRTVVAANDGGEMVADTVASPPASSIRAGSTCSVTAGVPSSSAIVSRSAAGAVNSRSPCAAGVAVTVTTWSGAS